MIVDTFGWNTSHIGVSTGDTGKPPPTEGQFLLRKHSKHNYQKSKTDRCLKNRSLRHPVKAHSCDYRHKKTPTTSCRGISVLDTGCGGRQEYVRTELAILCIKILCLLVIALCVRDTSLYIRTQCYCRNLRSACMCECACSDC